jgi:hypothetical protein
MADDDIVETITIEGADQAAADFDKIGQAGSKAFEGVAQSAEQAAGPIGVIDAMAKRAGVSFEEMNARVAASTAGVSAMAAANTKVAASSAEAAAGLEAEAVAATEAAAASKAASVSLTGMSTALRSLARATGISELSKLAAVFRVLAKVGPIAIPAVLIAGLERVAASAAAAADKIGELSDKAGVSTQQFQEVAQVGAAAGIGVDKMGAAVQGVGKLFQESAKNADDYAKKTTELKNQQAQLERQATTLTNRMADLKREIVLGARDQAAAVTGFLDAFANVGDDVAKQSALLNEFSKATENFNHQNEVRQREQAALIDQQAELTARTIANRKALSDAAAEFAKNGNVLDKLGISAKDANGKIKTLSTDSLKQLADAFANLSSDQQAAATVDLIAAGVDRHLIPALKKGAAGIDEFNAKAAELPTQLTPAQIAVGETFVEAEGRFSEAMKRLKDSFGIQLSPAFTQILDQISSSLKTLQPVFNAIGQAFAGFLQQISDTASKLSNILAPLGKFIELLGKIPGVATALKGLDFGIVGKALASALAPITIIIDLLDKLVTNGAAVVSFFQNIGPNADKAFNAAATAFGNFLTRLTSVIGTDPLGDLWNAIKAGGVAVWGAITQAASDAWKFIVDLWNTLTQPIVDVWNAIVGAASNAWQSIKDVVSSAVNSIVTFFQPLIDILKRVWDMAKQAAQALGLVSKPADTSPVPAFARGGRVNGPGTTNSDSIFARLSRGEFVIRAAAVDKYGPAFFAMLNAMRMPSFDLGSLAEAITIPTPQWPGYARGGLVAPAPAPGSGRPLQLTIEGESFDLNTRDASTGQKMERYLLRRSTRAGGRRGQAWTP